MYRCSDPAHTAICGTTCLCDIHLNPCCYCLELRQPPPPLSRQDATVQEQEYPIREKARVWWKENYESKKDSGQENKENVPPKDFVERPGQQNVPQKEGRYAERSCTSQQRST